MRAALVPLAFAALAAFAGCRDEELETLEAIRDEVCACKTVSCVDAAMKRIPERTGPSSHKEKRVARKMMECIAERYQAPAPKPPEEE